MNLGGKFLNNAEGSASASSAAVRGGGYGDFGDRGDSNGVLGEVVRPQFRGTFLYIDIVIKFTFAYFCSYYTVITK